MQSVRIEWCHILDTCVDQHQRTKIGSTPVSECQHEQTMAPILAPCFFVNCSKHSLKSIPITLLQVIRWMDRWMDGRKEGWVDGWMDGWRWIDGLRGG